MSFSEVPPPAERDPGSDLPELRVRPPGPQSRTWLTRHQLSAAPMGPSVAPEIRSIVADVPQGAIVYSTARGSNVIDVDSNRYVDLAQGFGAQLLGHRHKNIVRVLELQAQRLLQALGDVHPSDAKIGLMQRLLELYPEPGRVILGQSGADAISAALKTAVLFTGKPGVIAFEGSYHGLSYGPLSVSGLRASYRAPFASQINPHVVFAPYPESEAELGDSLQVVADTLERGQTGAVLIEPILGRGGVIVPAAGTLTRLHALAEQHGALLIADEIWTGLGRAGALLESFALGSSPHLVCLGKGLGGGLPISACIGRADVMQAWSRTEEVVHTSTFAGAPLACATALGLLDVLSREALPQRADVVGARWLARLRESLAGQPLVSEVRGKGLMVGIELAPKLRNGAVAVQRALLERGYITSTGGGKRDVLILTPALNIAEALLDDFTAKLSDSLRLFGY